MSISITSVWLPSFNSAAHICNSAPRGSTEMWDAMSEALSIFLTWRAFARALFWICRAMTGMPLEWWDWHDAQVIAGCKERP